MVLPFTYDEFEGWHRKQSERLLAPALKAANAALDAYFDEQLTENQRVRVRVAPGRVKNVPRTWRKLNLPKYEPRVTTLDAIPTVLDDLIATRIICTNTSDLNRVWDLLRALDTWEEGHEPILALEAESDRDYCENPKPSGYRARHINVRTAVNDGLTRSLVTCEIQVRTLLQDSWGELTHEDTYKPGSKIPPIVTTLSRRMADLLATLDEIAEDLRGELDLASEDALEAGDGTVLDDSEVGAEDASVEAIEVAARSYLQRRIATLSAPLDLASLAWELQRELGQEIAAGWLGHGTFKSLLLASVPDVRISSTPPAFVIPAEYSVSEAFISASAVERAQERVPLPVMFLRRIDRSLPLYDTAGWQKTFSYLAAASSAFLPDATFDMRLLNELTRIARDRSLRAGDPMPRAAFAYVAKGIWYRNELRSGMASDEIGEKFFNAILTRIREATTVSDAARQEIRAWLGLGAEELTG
jgi:ppGpp synthetase/RelA/SpoT-type nucleotidyltranferase